MTTKKFSHTDKFGKAKMVEVSTKKETRRTAQAFAEVQVLKEVFDEIKSTQIQKGDVPTVVKLAGNQTAKKTSELIPLCHNMLISSVAVDLNLNEKKKSIEIRSLAQTSAQTGIERKALIAVRVTALTIYNRCKAPDKSIPITKNKWLRKTGGKSGTFSNQ